MASSASRIAKMMPPESASAARFAPDFGQRVLLTVDTEEEFDWNGPFSREGFGLEHIAALSGFQSLCEEIGAHPVYLVDWPIAGDKRAGEIIGDAVKRGKADVGVQLHPWVNPPFDEEIGVRNSFAGNLPSDLERSKFEALRKKIETSFDVVPKIYRAGRYGLGPNSAQMLKDGGIEIDSSVRSLFDYSHEDGPDYTNHPTAPFWLDEERSLLELPLTTVYWGVLRQLGKQIHRAQRHMPTFFGGFSKFGLLERIPLTPEGVSIEEAIRGIDIALDDGLPLLVLSLHSPSLAPGFTPYAQSQAEVEAMHDWMRQIYAYLDRRDVRSTTPPEIVQAVMR